MTKIEHNIYSKNNNFSTIFTIFVFVLLASLDNAAVSMLPPLFSSIAKDLGFHVSGLGIISAVSIFIISLSAVFWAFLSTKASRKLLIILGTIIWSISVFITSISNTFFHLLFSQFFTGIGLGCISAIGFSILSDSVSKKWRGTVMSLWAMSQGFGTIAGSLMASTIAPLFTWRKPFEVLSILGFVFLILYFLIKEPPRGGSEPELQELFEKGATYEHSIKLKDIRFVFSNKSNLLLMLETLFINISNGTLIWLPTLFIARLEHAGVPTASSIVAAGFIYAVSQAGGIISIYLGYIGDKLQRRNLSGRALFTSALVFLSCPLYIIAINIPLKNFIIFSSTNPFSVISSLAGQLISNQWFIMLIIAAILASAANSVNYPNWLAMLIDVNLPEHRAAMFSIANLVTGTGRALGNALIGWVLGYLSGFFSEPDNYSLSLSFFQLFVIPAVIFLIMISRTCRKDIVAVKNLLSERAKQKLS